jgi:phosphate transport system permease protein
MNFMLDNLRRVALAYDPFRFETGRVSVAICLAFSLLSILVLIGLLAFVLWEGWQGLSPRFFLSGHVENQPHLSGISQALAGSAVLCVICVMFAMPLGIGTAVYLEEFEPKNAWLRRLRQFFQININNLAGVPSVVYGILGVTAFVYLFGLFAPIQVGQKPFLEIGTRYYYQVKTLASGLMDESIEVVYFPAPDPANPLFEIEEELDAIDGRGERIRLKVLQPWDPWPTGEEELRRAVLAGTVASRFAQHDFHHLRLPLGRSVLAAGMTLSLVILPMVIIVSQEALRRVPDRLREGALALGATRWQMVRQTVLPTAMPGIMTGAILAMSRAVGEAAPVIAVMGGLLATTRNLGNLMDPSPALPVTIYKWTLHPNNAYDALAASAIIVLLLFLVSLNSIAIYVRYRFESNQRGL